jgi:hypothetical protein
LKKKEKKEVVMEVKEEFEEDPLLLHFFPLKIHPDLVSFITSNPHTKPSSSLTMEKVDLLVISSLSQSNQWILFMFTMK